MVYKRNSQEEDWVNIQKIEYIGNDEKRGIQYDWAKIRKRMKKLDLIPKDYYNPCTAPLDTASIFVEVSERAVGKTTSWLLLGLVMHEMYGTITVYVRSKADMIAPKNSNSIYNVILANHYIEKITNGKYNHITYKSRKWYLCNINENGEITTISPNYCMRMVSIDDGSNLKSTFNEPKADLMLFDEFIPVLSRFVVVNEFVQLVDLFKTVFRDRECCKVVMLANTIDKYNQYFHDLEIFERVASMDFGDNCIHTTSGGTKIYVELIGVPRTFKRRKDRWNRLFAGFNKPELAPITGNAVWAMKMYQHIPEIEKEEDQPEIVFSKLYVYHQNKYIRLDFVDNHTLGICIYVHWATKTHSDSIIFTSEPIYDNRYIYGMGEYTKIGKTVLDLIGQHKVYYAANDVGAFFENYLISCGYNTKRYI